MGCGVKAGFTSHKKLFGNDVCCMHTGADDGAGDEAEGLADYGATEAPEELLSDAAAYSGIPALGRAPDPAILENLHALQREIVNRHLPTLQDWLRVMVKASSYSRRCPRGSQNGLLLRLVRAHAHAPQRPLANPLKGICIAAVGWYRLLHIMFESCFDTKFWGRQASCCILQGPHFGRYSVNMSS